MYHHVLLASGGAAHSRQAEQRAVDLAKAFEAKPSLLSVVRNESLPVMMGAGLDAGGTVDYAEMLEGQQQQQAQVLAEACLRCEQHGVKPATLIRRGNAGKEIVEVAKELGCDLIVVGSRKLSMMSAIARGSVSDYVMRHAEVDVLIVH